MCVETPRKDDKLSKWRQN